MSLSCGPVLGTTTSGCTTWYAVNCNGNFYCNEGNAEDYNTSNPTGHNNYIQYHAYCGVQGESDCHSYFKGEYVHTPPNYRQCLSLQPDASHATKLKWKRIGVTDMDDAFFGKDVIGFDQACQNVGTEDHAKDQCPGCCSGANASWNGQWIANQCGCKVE